MKPLQLIIQAFGPFAETETINFEKLGRNPLFLINGPTGAGKSSILDAICFALYGQSSGAERDPHNLRCDRSDPNLLTEISLDFSLADKRYRVRRVPTQERAKLRQQGTTTQNTEAQLWQLQADGETRLLVPKKANEVSLQIKELIGLNVEQFRQVMVLPQGKFVELLNADSNNREKIFSQLFQTHAYKRIEEQLKSQAAGIRQAVDEHRNQIKGVLQTIDADSKEQLELLIKGIQPDLASHLLLKNQAFEALQQTIEEKKSAENIVLGFDKLADKQRELEYKTTLKPEYINKQECLTAAFEAQKLVPLHQQKQQQKARIENIKTQLASAKQHSHDAKTAHQTAISTLETATTAHQAVEGLQENYRDLLQHQNNVLELNKANTLCQQADKKLALSEDQLNSKRQQLQALQSKQLSLETQLAKLVSEQDVLAPKQIELQQLKLQLNERKQLDKLLQQRELLEQNIDVISAELKLKTEQTTEAKLFTQQREFSWHSGQAALLAQQLQDEQACPVCGSKEHPVPAKAMDGDKPCDLAQVEAARDAEKNCRAIEQKTYDQLQQEKNKQLNFQQQIEQAELRNKGLLATSTTMFQQQCEALEAEVQTLLNQHDKKVLIEQSLTKLSTQLLQSETQQHDAEDEFQQAKTQCAVLSASMKQVEDRIPLHYQQADVLNKELKALNANIQLLRNDLEQANKRQVNARSSFDQANSNYQSLQGQYKQAEQEGIQQADLWLNTLQNSCFETELESHNALLDEQQQITLEKDIHQYRSTCDNLSGAIKQLNTDLKGKSIPDIEKIKLKLEQKSQDYSAADEQWHQLEKRSSSLQSVQQKLQQMERKNAELDAQYAVIGTLSEVANGQTGNKVSLQRFVLSVLLDDVLIQASKRLNLMSKGRYRLERKEERAKGNKASGLDLEVEDEYSGKSRAVSTLSGGESFMAALSLALGLSDVVQSYAGGIKLDALFIDEGFGSLDTESLDLAINSLIELQASGRMIGIISHVSELKEQMPLRLDVISTLEGSRVKMAGV